MSFLAPWFLLGAVAIGGPILFHLIRRAARERMPFSSVMFLRPTPPRMTRRRRIEHFWLLLLRCLCLLLLVTGFARPFFADHTTGPADAGAGRQLVLLVDTSASMQRADLWGAARSLAARHLDDTTFADQVALMTFDRQPRMLVSFSQWNAWTHDQRPALARQQLSTVEPGWMGTQLGAALVAAAEQFFSEAADGRLAGRREIIVITDLQEGAKLDGLQGYDWPDGVTVQLERVGSNGRANAGLAFLDATSGRVNGQGPQVRVANARDSGREKFHLTWSAGGSISDTNASEIYLPPGQTRTFPAPALASGITGAELRLTGDDEPFDNAAHYVPAGIDQVKIAYWGSDAANDPSRLRYYLQRVFPETQQRTIEIVAPPEGATPSANLLADAAFAVVPGAITQQDASALRAWIAEGKTALLILTDVRAGPALAVLAGIPEANLAESGGNYALLGEIDFRHPIFGPFADPRFSDFTQIHFWKHRRWTLPDEFAGRVLAKFDDGSPALVQVPIGRGILVVLTSGWQPADSQLAVASKFPPLMHALLSWSGAAETARLQFLTGDSIPSPAASSAWPAESDRIVPASPSQPSQATGPVQWRKPDGAVQSLAVGAAFTATDRPGIYTASFGDRQRRFAVNLPLDESRTALLSPDELARLGVPLQSSMQPASVARVQEQQRYLQRAELENRQKLWRWLLLAVLVIALGEILLSGWLARRIQPAEPATAPAASGRT